MSELLTNDGIEDFLEKYKNAKGFNSKEMRLTIQEAERLSIGIALLLSKYQKMADHVIELQEILLEPDDVVLSGGGFS
jgi:hypothetical protein